MQQDAPTVDMERWQRLTARLSEELARGFSLSRIATDAEISNRHGISVSRLPSDRLREWSINPEAMRTSRYTDQLSPADEIEQKLTTFFAELDAERSTAKTTAVPFVETAISRKVWGGFEQARELCELVEISAPPGTGKTCAVEQYLDQCRKLEGFGCPVWRITLSEFSLSIKNVLYLISDEAGVNRSTVNNSSDFEMVKAIEERTEGLGGLLIVDEAQHIGDASKINGLTILNSLRHFVDRKLFGIAFLSNGEIYRRVAGGKHGQLSSRMEAWRVDVRNVPDEDVYLIMAAWGLSGKLAREWCIKKVKGAGGLRTLTNAFRHADREFGEINHKTLTMLERV
jgi:DNA transposition AAA+ family ATPase